MKQLIAVDVDEVLCDGIQDFIDYSNDQFGTKLTIADYDEHWSRMWQIDQTETQRRAHQWHVSGKIGRHANVPDAADILRHLAKDYNLVVTTSRREILRDQTLDWLTEHFDGVFKDVHFAGFYDSNIDDRAFAMTKAGLYREIGADYAIDDQLKHCLAADDQGMSAILFGEYPWNQTDTLRVGITRCKNWSAVGAYFDGRA